jgi:pimeloyl-ACP methyl ester carboxylesterase
MSLNQKLALKYIRTKFSILSSFSKRKAAEKAFELFCTPQYRNRKKLPTIFEKGENIKLEYEGESIQGYRWNKDAEKKVLILHGFESSVINFDRYINPLIKKDFCVLAFDAPAHGRSSGKMINALIYSQFIHFINEKFGPVKSYIAHSMGGLALSLFIEKVKHDETYKLVFIAPATETISAANSLFKFLKLDQGVRKAFEALIQEKSGYPMEWFSVARVAPQIKAKVLWCHDKNDDMTPYSDAEPVLEKKYPNFDFYITEGLGHRRIYRDNKVNKRILDFISDQPINNP